jgi:hypothetical protein
MSASAKSAAVTHAANSKGAPPYTGKEFLESLDDGREIWIYGRIRNSTAPFPCIGLYVRNAERSIDPVGAEIVARNQG